MVDVDARKRLAALIRAYLNEEMTAFEFDEALGEFRWEQDDETVDEIAKALWFCYDDLRDHLVVATKEEWDSIQRMLLVLESGCELESRKVRMEPFGRSIAALSLLLYGMVFGCTLLGMGWHPNLILVSVPFGAISIFIFYMRCREESRNASEMATAPFASISQMLRARRHVPGFRKQPYPRALAKRKIRPRFVAFLLFVTSYGLIGWVPCVLWLFLAPAVLLYQSLSRSDATTRVADPV